MTWNVEQGKKEGILVAGGQGGDLQVDVMREDSEGEKGMDPVHYSENLVVPEIEPGPQDLQPGTVTSRPQRRSTVIPRSSFFTTAVYSALLLQHVSGCTCTLSLTVVS
jgi:hypothetical protein